MPTYTIYATRNSSATLRSRDTASYANARDGVNTGGYSSRTGTGGFSMYVGQSDIDGNIYYSYDVTGLIFDTSAVTGSITSATLEIYVGSTTGAADWDIEARVHDFGGAVTWPGDFVDADDLAAKTLLATLTKSAITAAAYNAFTDVAMAANVNTSGTTEIILASSRSRTATAPATAVTERVTFTSPTDPLAANGPRLIIETEIVPTGDLSQTIDAITVTSASVLPITGAAENTIDAITVSSTGELIGTGEGAVNNTFDAFTLSSTVGIGTFGHLAKQLPVFTLTSASTLEVVAGVDATIDPVTVTAEGAFERFAELSADIGTITLQTSTAVGISGELSVSIGEIAISALQSGPAWPVVYDFPQAPLDGTWRRMPGDDTLRSDRKVGARLYRGRDGGNHAEVEFAVMLNGSAQVGEMDRFYRDDCGNGSRRFYWPHPETGSIVAWTWATPPVQRHIAGRVFRVECQLRMEAA